MTGNRTAAVTEGSAPPVWPVGSAPARVDWVDYAKGICIVMVVMMHSVLGVELAEGQTGFMHLLVAFAKPFRMPDFFLISGLFLPIVIERDWRTYLDRKVVHFAYFYGLWVTIQFAFKAPHFAAESGWAGVGFSYLESFIEPFGTLWFIYLLPIFFVVTKATRRMPPLLIWGVAALLECRNVVFKNGAEFGNEIGFIFVFGNEFARITPEQHSAYAAALAHQVHHGNTMLGGNLVLLTNAVTRRCTQYQDEI